MNGEPKQDDLFTRHWGRTILEFGDEEIALYSAHLHPSDDAVRAREITEVLRVLEAEKDSGRLVLFQGDFNHTPDGPEYQRWAHAGWVDAQAAKGDPADFTHPSAYASEEPNRRIDYIWTHGEMAKRLTSARVLSEGAFRTKPNDPSSFALSDHMPVVADFE